MHPKRKGTLVHIMGLPGSLRSSSVNRRLLHAAAQVLPAGCTLEIYDGVGRLPLFDEDIETEPPHEAVADLRATIVAADALLIATPEYNSSIPGPLKNALDWASRPHTSAPLAGKPVGVVGASPSRFGAVRAQADVRKVAASIGADVVDEELPVARAFDAFGQDGRLTDRELESQLTALVRQLLGTAARHADQPLVANHPAA